MISNTLTELHSPSHKPLNSLNCRKEASSQPYLDLVFYTVAIRNCQENLPKRSTPLHEINHVPSNLDPSLSPPPPHTVVIHRSPALLRGSPRTRAVVPLRLVYRTRRQIWSAQLPSSSRRTDEREGHARLGRRRK